MDDEPMLWNANTDEQELVPTVVAVRLVIFLCWALGRARLAGGIRRVRAKTSIAAEPPPHVHSRQDEFFYVLAGEMKVYVEGEVFVVRAGECMFLPRGKPHAFLVTSEELHNIALITPGGFLDAVNKMNAPAERMEVRSDIDTITCANADLTDIIRVFERYGVRFLSADEIRAEMPEYPR